MKGYTEPKVDFYLLQNEDILTVSGDENDLWGNDIFDVFINSNN